MKLNLPDTPNLLVACLSLLSVCHSAQASTETDTCLLDAIARADDTATVGELRATCESRSAGAAGSTAQTDSEAGPENQSLLAKRLAQDAANEGREYIIMTHRPNYIIYSYNSKANQQPFATPQDPNPVDDDEMKFQVSFKMPLWRGLFDTDTDLLFAYTSTSWWQLFNDELSAPFRETNYEPEIFVRHYGGPEFLGGNIAGWDFGFVHQSNGRSDPLSRSWNRVFGTVGYDYGDFALAFKGWWRIPEDDDDDDNPNMYRYYGYGEMRGIWAPNKNTFTAMFRPGTQEVAYELTWSYQVSRYIRLYTQYFNGYGESLLDYNQRTQRIGFGFALNDYLQND